MPLAEASGMLVTEFVELIGKLRSVLKDLVPRPPPLVAPPTGIANKHHWGNLISQFYLVPHVKLDTSTVLVGFSPQCNVKLSDPSFANVEARIFFSGSRGVVESISGDSPHLNGVPLPKGKRSWLHPGDEITFRGATKVYSYVYQALVAGVVPNGDPHAAVSALPVLGPAVTPPEGAFKVSNAMPTEEVTMEEEEAPVLNVNGVSPAANEVAADKAGSSGATDAANDASRTNSNAITVSENTFPGALSKSKQSGKDEGDALPKRVTFGGVSMGIAPPSPSPSDEVERSKECEAAAKAAALKDHEAQIAAIEAAAAKYCEANLTAACDIGISFENFPYTYISKDLCDLLLTWVFVHFKHPEVAAEAKYAALSPPKLLLCGAQGTDLYLKAIVRAVANEYGANLLYLEIGQLTEISAALTPHSQETIGKNARSDDSFRSGWKSDAENVDGREATVGAVDDGEVANICASESNECNGDGGAAVVPASFPPESMSVDQAAVKDAGAAVAFPGAARVATDDGFNSPGLSGAISAVPVYAAFNGRNGDEPDEKEAHPVAAKDSSSGDTIINDDKSTSQIVLSCSADRGKDRVFKVGDRVVYVGRASGSSGSTPSSNGASCGSGKLNIMPSISHNHSRSGGSGSRVAPANQSSASQGHVVMKSNAVGTTNRVQAVLRSSARGASRSGRESGISRSPHSHRFSWSPSGGRLPGRPSPEQLYHASKARSVQEARDRFEKFNWLRTERDRDRGREMPGRVDGSSRDGSSRDRSRAPALMRLFANDNTRIRGDEIEGASYPGDRALDPHYRVSGASVVPSESITFPGDGGGGPKVGDRGRVLLTFDGDSKRVGVRFDSDISNGNDLGNLCEYTHGCFCKPQHLALESNVLTGVKPLPTLFETVCMKARIASASKPLIVYVPDASRALMELHEKHPADFWELCAVLENPKPYVVLIGSTAPSSTICEEVDKANAGSSCVGRGSTGLGGISTMSGGPGSFGILRVISGGVAGSGALNSGGNPFDFPDYLGNGGRMSSERPMESNLSPAFKRIFPRRVAVESPAIEGPLDAVFKSEIEADVKKLKMSANVVTFKAVMKHLDIECPGLASVNEFTTQVFSTSAAETIVGLAVSAELRMRSQGTSAVLILSGKALSTGVALSKTLHRDAKTPSSPTAKLLKDVKCDDFEAKLLADVVPASDIGVKFDDIGALDSVKSCLFESVMLPLRRPGLFKKGNLSKPTKGVLLFGPPGTGKTMLAKAVATEAGASFLSVSSASINSKWLGESEKMMKAVFSLANKLAPAIIFIDEVDAVLGSRGRSSEHEASRRSKNELLSQWDGLRTSESNRVLVFGCTNRPFDLDQASLRRFSRRILVDLPDSASRARILRLVTAKEDLAADVDLNALAASLEGYTGSDIRNLCVTAAMQPIRELIEKEKVDNDGQILSSPMEGEDEKEVRALRMADFMLAKEKSSASVSEDASSIAQLRSWNTQYGETGSRQKESLAYFL
jgi:AAA+ superfamily predicted ATPase